jgi:hypothetical protein
VEVNAGLKRLGITIKAELVFHRAPRPDEYAEANTPSWVCLHQDAPVQLVCASTDSRARLPNASRILDTVNQVKLLHSNTAQDVFLLSGD